jgi:drug/metabolite transporter (DMT)-like permease
MTAPTSEPTPEPAPEPPSRRRSVLPYVWMLCGCFTFAWMGEFAHELGHTQHCDWRLIALARSSLVLGLAIGLTLAGRAPFVFWHTPILWVRSVAGSLSLVCTFYAFTCLRTPEVLTLTNTFPIWVALLSWPLLRVRPTGSVALAAVCGVAGIFLIQQASFDGAGLAFVLALLAAFCSAVAMLGLHRLTDLDARAIVVHFSGVATVLVVAVCLLGQLLGKPVPWEQMREREIALLLVGVGVTATVGQLFLTQAFRTGEPARVSVVGLTQIVFVLALDPLFGQSSFHPSTLAGIGLVLAPTAWVLVGRVGDP